MILPEPANLEQTVAGVFALAANVAVPPGSPYEDGGVYPTWWTAGADLTNRTYYFLGNESPSLTWVEFTDLDSDQVTSVNPRQEGLIGNIADRLEPAALPY